MSTALSCDKHDGYVDGCRDCLRAWLDRRPPSNVNAGMSKAEFEMAGGFLVLHERRWHVWFDGDEYRGERSARTGPDHVGAEHHCGCEQCSGKVST